MEDKDFAKGLFVKDSNVDFVKFKISIKKEEFTQWYKEKLQNKDEDWINLDVKEFKATYIRYPSSDEIPYPTMMSPGSVVEFYSR